MFVSHHKKKFNLLMKKKALLFLFLAGMSFATVRAADVFDTIMHRVAEREFLWLTAPRSIQPRFTLILPDADGGYADLNYGDKNELVNWQPIFHLTRLEQLAIAYACPASERKGDAALYDAVVRGLRYWQQVHPVCKNWWWNQIGDPIALGRLLIVMRMGARPLPAELEADVIARWAAEGGNPTKWTGANKTDIALHWIYQACLTRDEKKLAFAIEQGYQPIVITTKEGLQNDFSYHQHGPQLYIGGYGDAFLYDAVAIATLVRGTKYALESEKLDLLRRFTNEGWLPTMRSGYRFYNTLGRSLTRMGGVELADSASNIVGMMRDIDAPSRRPFYDTVVQRMWGKLPASAGVHPFHRHYWRSDFTLFQRPEMTVDVRLRSRKTLTLENGNGENLRGYFLSDGSMDIAVRGDEYAGLFPVWNWARIPGVTAPDLDTVPAYPGWNYYGTSRFAGGVSDGLCGATGYVYRDTTAAVMTAAHKGWFFFDDAVVCLGAGITSQSAAPVATTLNQCRLRGRVEWQEQGATKEKDAGLFSRKFEAQKGDYVSHDGVTYYFAEGGKVELDAQEQSGSWYDINTSMPKDLVTKDVFTLRLQHGVRPHNAGYAYVLMPTEKFRPKAAAQYRVLQNTPQAQIVRQGTSGLAGLIAFSAGTYQIDGLSLSVSAPCALWLKPEGRKRMAVAVADPSRDLAELTVTVNGRGVGNHTLHFKLNPSPDAFAGRSIVAHLTSHSPERLELTANHPATP